MAKRKVSTAGSINELKNVLKNPQFRDILLAGGRVRAGDIPLTDRPVGVQDQQQISLSDVGRAQTENILTNEANRAQITRLADLRAALANQRQVRGNAGQPLTSQDVTGVTERFLPPAQRLQSQINTIVGSPTAPIGTSANTFQPITIAPTEPTVAIGQRTLTDSTRMGGAQQKISNLIRQGLLRLKQTATGAVTGGVTGAAGVATNPTLTPSSPIPEDLIARTLQDVKTKATKALKGTTLEAEAIDVLKAIDPRFGALSKQQRSEIAGFEFRNPRTNQIIRINKAGGFEVVS